MYIKADFGCIASPIKDGLGYIALYIRVDCVCIASSIKANFEIRMYSLIFFPRRKIAFFIPRKQIAFFIPNKNEKHLLHTHMALYKSSEDSQRHLRTFKNNCPKRSLSPYYPKTTVLNSAF